MNDNFGYNSQPASSQPAYWDPTVKDSGYQGYPPPYAPNSVPLPQYPTANQPSPMAPTVLQPIYVPYPVVVSDSGDSMAVTGLIFGILSAAIGWIPVCGLVALFPGMLGIIFGGLGLKSARKRGMAIAGIVLSIIGIALSFIVLL